MCNIDFDLADRCFRLITFIIWSVINFFAEMLEKESDVHQSEMEDIRVGISKFSFGILMYKISYKDYNKALKVQHYLQHEDMKDIKMEEFIRKIPDSSDLQ